MLLEQSKEEIDRTIEDYTRKKKPQVGSTTIWEAAARPIYNFFMTMGKNRMIQVAQSFPPIREEVDRLIKQMNELEVKRRILKSQKRPFKTNSLDPDELNAYYVGKTSESLAYFLTNLVVAVADYERHLLIEPVNLISESLPITEHQFWKYIDSLGGSLRYIKNRVLPAHWESFSELYRKMASKVESFLIDLDLDRGHWDDDQVSDAAHDAVQHGKRFYQTLMKELEAAEEVEPNNAINLVRQLKPSRGWACKDHLNSIELL